MHDFIRTIFYLFRQAIPPALIGLAIGAVLLVLLNQKYRQKGIQFPKGQAVAVLLLLCYLGGLVSITFMNRIGNGMQMYQLYPFLAFWEAWNAFTLQVWLNPLLNIAMFVPLGVFLPLAAKPFRRWYWMLAAEQEHPLLSKWPSTSLAGDRPMWTISFAIPWELCWGIACVCCSSACQENDGKPLGPMPYSRPCPLWP